MTLPRYALDYSRCTRDELRAFISVRGLKITGKKRAKAVYVKTLTHADKHVSFRFLDLPTELRVLVYREVLLLRNLVWPNGFTLRRGCWPQILATCKEVNNEAHAILQKINKFSVRLTRSKVNSPFATRVEAVVGGSWPSPAPFEPLSHLPRPRPSKQPIHWHKGLRQLTHLQLTVDLRPSNPNDPGTVHNSYSVQECLYRLCSFLAPENKLERVDVQFHIPDNAYDVECRLLFALAKLRIPDRLHIQGLSEDAVGLLNSRGAAHVAKEDDCGRAGVAFDRLYALQLVVHPYQSPFSIVDGSTQVHRPKTQGRNGGSGEPQDCVPSDILDIARDLHPRLDALRECFDQTHDQELGRLVSKLETRLDEELRGRMYKAETKALSLESEAALAESAAASLKSALEWKL